MRLFKRKKKTCPKASLEYFASRGFRFLNPPDSLEKVEEVMQELYVCETLTQTRKWAVKWRVMVDNDGEAYLRDLIRNKTSYRWC